MLKKIKLLINLNRILNEIIINKTAYQKIILFP